MHVTPIFTLGFLLFLLSGTGYSVTSSVVPTDHATIQGAIDASANGELILVMPGTYLEHINFTGKAITVKSFSNASDTWIDGNGLGTVVTCDSGEGPDTILNGFTIYNGMATDGGGMFIGSSSPTVIHCVFKDNTAVDQGGGLYHINSEPRVKRCTFQGNAAQEGGAIFNQDCSFLTTVHQCDFHGNSAVGYGGAIFNYFSRPTITQCTFQGNSAEKGGALYNHFFSTFPMLQCTFYGNSASISGGAIYNNHGSNLNITNCIFWDSLPQEIENDSISNPAVTYSCIQGGYPGVGNIADHPLFKNPANLDFRLTPGSPCIDAGENHPTLLPATDFEGDPRIFSGNGKGYFLFGPLPPVAVVDMGIDEYCQLKKQLFIPR